MRSIDPVLFAFENDFVTTLRCIPMAVRFKLDLCGVKLSLRQWSRFTQEDRRSLLFEPCADPQEAEGYRQRLNELVFLRLQEPTKPLPPGSAVPWREAARTPKTVLTFARSVDVEPPDDADWRRLTDLQRFVLLKLSLDNHDNVNFIPALQEFGLYRTSSLGGTAGGTPSV